MDSEWREEADDDDELRGWLPASLSTELYTISMSLSLSLSILRVLPVRKQWSEARVGGLELFDQVEVEDESSTASRACPACVRIR